MSGIPDNSENRKKLFFLTGFVGIVLIVFIAIVLIAGYVGLMNDLHIPFIGGNNTAQAATGSIYADTDSTNGVTLTSLNKSVDLIVSSLAGSRWSGLNPAWFIYDARADYVNSQGLSQQWLVTLRSDSSMLVGVVNNGQISNVTVYDMPVGNDSSSVEDGVEVVEQYPDYNATALGALHPGGSGIFDTGRVMSLALKEMSVSIQPSSMPFSIDYNGRAEPATYTVYYTDEATPKNSILVQLDAVTGHILRSDRGVTR